MAKKPGAQLLIFHIVNNLHVYSTMIIKAGGHLWMSQ